jgi:hypothetical protein
MVSVSITCTSGDFVGIFVWSSPMGSYSSVPSKPCPSAMAFCRVGISSVSHQAVRTSPTLAPPMSRATSAAQSQPQRRRFIAEPKKTPNGTAKMDIQRHGNCTNRSLGSTTHKTELNRSISRIASPASKHRTYQTSLPILPLGEDGSASSARRAAIAASPARIIISTARLETIQLNIVCSGSLICV